MQWLIDILAAKVIAEIGIPPVYVKRDDVEHYDFDKDDFTRDGNYYDLDLSGIVPEGASAVYLGVLSLASAIGLWYGFGPSAPSTDQNYTNFATMGTGYVLGDGCIVPLDANRKIGYYVCTGAWVSLDVVILGWWL